MNSAILAPSAGNEPPDVFSPYNLRLNRGVASYSLQHQFNGNFSYQMPFGNGQRFGSGATGWVVPPNDPVALAYKIGEIVARPESWCQFPDAARARYEAMFESRVIARQIQAIVGGRLKSTKLNNEPGLAHG